MLIDGASYRSGARLRILGLKESSIKRFQTNVLQASQRLVCG